MNKCPHCKTSSLQVKAFFAGDIVDSSSLSKEVDEFVHSVEYEIFYKVKCDRDHLSYICTSCDWYWRSKMPILPGLLEPREVQPGDTWYAKLEGDIALSRLKIIDTTDQTVAVQINGMQIDPPPRYMYEDIVFVEKQA